ncbi:hypothetical protein Tco_1186174 [Tanacetum coccineum]
MSITKEQHQALDDALVPREQRLRIGNCNYRLITTFKPKEPTFQVALDVLSLTPFYQVFLIYASVPAIYMHEFWATVSYHKHCIKFKLNKKNHSFDLETFRDMLQICPNLPGQKFIDPLFEKEILAFIRELGYSGDIKSLSDVKVDTLHQPWRTFGTIINKCLSDLVYQIENKEAKKNKDMYYPRFTKVIINHFMSKDQSILRRNKVDWHMAKDDPILTTMRFIPKHETVQKYGAILPDTLTNQAMKESDAYKTYLDFATGKVIPKPKYVRRSTREKTEQAPIASPEIALSEAEQMKIVTKRSKIDFHSSHASGSGANEGTGVSPGVPDVPTYRSKDEQISWKSSDEDDDDEVSMSKDDDDNAENEDDDDDDNEQTESDNDGDDFVHPKFSTHDEEEIQDEEDKEEEWSDDEAYDEVTQGGNVEKEKMDEEKTNEEDEINELYSDVNINLERRDTEMTDAPQTNVQATQVIEDTHVIITAVTPEVQQQSSSVSSSFISNMLNPNPNTGIDSILNLNTESTSLVDVPVTNNAEMPPSSVTTLPPPPIPLIQPLQQTPVSTPTIIPSTSLQNLPTFGSLFKFKDRVKALEDDFSKLKQTNLFAKAVSSILGIVDNYLANKMNEAIKEAVQLQSDRLKDEAQAENEDFINNLDENIKKIIKEQVKVQVKEQVSMILPRIKKSVNEQLEAEVLTRLSNEAKTSHAVAANLSELESHQAEEPTHTAKDLEEPAHQEFKTGFTKDHLVDETTQLPDWFQKPAKPPTPDRDWNKTLPAIHGPIQPWISTLARKEDPRESFNELMDTPLDFLTFMLNRLKVNTLTPELLVGLTFELLKGSYKSLVELEYFLQEVYKATTNQLDWNNPEGQQYPHDLRKPLPLIPNS